MFKQEATAVRPGERQSPNLRPLVAGLLFAALYVAFYSALGIGKPLGLICLTQQATMALRFKMLWGASGTALLTALIGHQVIGVHIVTDNTSQASKGARATIWRSILALTIILIIAEFTSDMGGGIALYISGIIKGAVSLYALALMALINILICFSFSLTLASCSCLASDNSDSPARVVVRISQLKASLYSSAAVLALSVLEIYSLFTQLLQRSAE
jgi:hypothetical protein